MFRDLAIVWTKGKRQCLLSSTDDGLVLRIMKDEQCLRRESFDNARRAIEAAMQWRRDLRTAHHADTKAE